MNKFVLHLSDILAHADAFQVRFGRWPRRGDGRVRGATGLTWGDIDAALKQGKWRLPRGSSLAQLLAEHRRGARNRNRVPRLKLGQVLAWADAHRTRTGVWPNRASGAIPEAFGETWAAVDAAFHADRRGLVGHGSLAQFLNRGRRRKKRQMKPELSIEKLGAWAQAHRRRTGRWPHLKSGPIPEARGLTWGAVHQALLFGYRGFPGGSSLSRALAALKQSTGVAPRSEGAPKRKARKAIARTKTAAKPTRQRARAGAPRRKPRS
jgi:hypothetical protein